MRCLQKLMGLSLLDRVTNDAIRSSCHVPKITDLLKYRRLRWLGHVGRMSEDRMPLQMLFSTLSGVGNIGRPLKSWNDYVREDLESIGLGHGQWWKKCKDRNQWKNRIELLLQRT